MTNNKFEDSFCQRKPEINYPCEWEYKVIGKNQEIIKKIIKEACAPGLPVITLSNVSSSGKYYSLNATLQVENEEMRLQIFDRIQRNSAVKMVI